MGGGRRGLYRRHGRGRARTLALSGQAARRNLGDGVRRHSLFRPLHLVSPCRRLSRTGGPLARHGNAHRQGRPATACPQPVRLYGRRLAGRGGRRRACNACRRLEEGDHLGAREPGTGETFRPADPLDLRGRPEIRAARGRGAAIPTTSSCSIRPLTGAGPPARSGNCSRTWPRCSTHAATSCRTGR